MTPSIGIKRISNAPAIFTVFAALWAGLFAFETQAPAQAPAAGDAAAAEKQETASLATDREFLTALERAELSMLFRGSSEEECRDWQKSFDHRLNELLGDSSPPGKWEVEEEQRWEFEDHVRVALLLKADSVPPVPVYLLIPRMLPPSGKAPAVLCVHGHGDFGNDPIVGRSDLDGVAENIEAHNYDYGLQFVRRGYVVAAPCMIPFGRRLDRGKYRSDPCAIAFLRLQALGRLAITENVRDLRWCLDLLQSRAEVDPDQIGCAGLSYGGRMTMLVSAVDHRIKVAAISGALNLMQERVRGKYSCGVQMIPGLLKYGDYSEIGSLIAPRPCVWETGSSDKLIVPEWDALFRERLRRVYKALGAEDQLHFDAFEGGHEWSGRIAFPLFDEVLRP